MTRAAVASVLLIVACLTPCASHATPIHDAVHAARALPDADAARICATAIGHRYAPLPGSAALLVCAHVVARADAHAVDRALAVAVAIRESELRPVVVSPIGCCDGPLQAHRRWWPGPGRVAAGVRALAYWLRRADDLREGLARYNAGWSPGPHAYAYADDVLRIDGLLRVARIHTSREVVVW